MVGTMVRTYVHVYHWCVYQSESCYIHSIICTYVLMTPQVHVYVHVYFAWRDSFLCRFRTCHERKSRPAKDCKSNNGQATTTMPPIAPPATPTRRPRTTAAASLMRPPLQSRHHHSPHRHDDQRRRRQRHTTLTRHNLPCGLCGCRAHEQ